MKLYRKDVISELAHRGDWYKNHTEAFLDALEEMLLDVLSQATLDDKVEIQLTKGFVVGATKNPPYDAVDPRNQTPIIVPERIVPYARFSQTFKEKINE